MMTGNRKHHVDIENGFWHLFVTSKDAIIIMHNDFIVDCNPKAMEIFGSPRDAIIGQSPFIFAPVQQPDGADSQKRAQEKVRSASSGYPQFFEWQISRRDGTLIDAEISLGRFESGGESFLFVTIRDITERKQADRALAESERKYRELVENTNGIMLGMDLTGRVTFFNKFAQNFFGYTEEEIIGLNVIDTIIPRHETSGRDLAVMIAGICADPERYALNETENIRKNGERVFVSWVNKACRDENGAINEILSIGQNITERKHLQKIMIQTEKMMMIGGLAAGMAHELNNPLGAIIQNLQNIQRRIAPGLPANEKVAAEAGIDILSVHRYLERRGIIEMLEYVSKAGSRAADIIANMLSFSRKGISRREAVFLPDVIEKTLELAACDYDLKKQYDFRTITVVREYDESLPAIVLNSMEIEQVLMNLLKNAAQALKDNPSDRPSRITMRTRRNHNYAFIEVADNGPGMTRATASRIFEPFFTTKEVGVGTGLGLSVSYALIVNNHRGTITVNSEPGEGATFIIGLPLLSESEP